MGKGLDSVRRIYMEGIAGGSPREAVEKYTGHRYTQHSTGVADGVEGFLGFFLPFVERNPKREIEIVRIFEDGRWVFCTAYQSLNEGAAEWVTTDLFYTDANGLILEHWDAIGPYTADTKSGNDMIRGTSEVDLSADTEASKDVVLEFTKQVLSERNFDRINQFVSQDLIERGAKVGPGRDGLAAWLASDEAGSYEMMFKLIGQGDFVAVHGKRHAKGKDIAVFDIYRVEAGMIVEHWSNEEEISPREAWGNSGKF